MTPWPPRRLIRRCVLVFALAALTLATGCFNLRQPRPKISRYALGDPMLASTEAPVWGKPEDAGCLLKVRPVRVDATYGDSKFVYRLGAAEWTADYYHVFLIPPGPMLTAIVETFVARTADADFVSVIPVSSVLSPTHLLETTVRELHADYSQPGQPRAVLAIEFILIDERAPAGVPRIVLQKTLRETVPLDDDKPSTLVAGWNAGLKQILLALTKELRDARLNGIASDSSESPVQ
jgi:hypothetical protein